MCCLLRLRCCIGDQAYQPSLSATVLARTDLVGLGIQVPQVLIPKHPPIIDGIAVGAVVVTIAGVLILVLSLVVRTLNSFARSQTPSFPQCDIDTKYIHGANV